VFFLLKLLKPRHGRGFSFKRDLLDRASHFSEPQIDHFVMAITAAQGHAGGSFLCAVERWRGSMRGEMINEYQKLNSEDQKTFRRWLWANTVVGAMLLAGLIALASKFPGDESVATAQLAGMRTQAKFPPERASVLPSR